MAKNKTKQKENRVSRREQHSFRDSQFIWLEY